MSANGTGDGASAALSQPAARRKFWGWSLEGQGLTGSELGQLGAVFAERLGIEGVSLREPPRVEELDLRTPRLAPPALLEPALSADPYDRAAHTYGRWDEIKLAASEAIAALGGTITHHHAVGRDHRRWYLREVPQLFADALRGAKAELDPAGIMNPGVLLEPAGPVTSSSEGGGR